MYWMRTGHAVDALGLVPFFAAAVIGGWLCIASAFEVTRRERALLGVALGLGLTIWLANLIGQVLPSAQAFSLAPALVLLTGILLAARRDGGLPRIRDDIPSWPLLLVCAVLAVVFIWIGRGLAIFDDRKALSLISTMAAGDIPPHFYMNWEQYFSYHYAFHLFGAMLMKLGGLFPWSAYDVAKGLTASMAVGLAYLLGRRLLGGKGGLALAFLLLFASGGRWLLLFLPHSVVAHWSDGISLWGSASQTAPNLATALASGWTLEGGPPVPIPFAFVNGILQPFILHLQAGPKSLALVLFLLILMLYGRVRAWQGWLLLVGVAGLWALAAEAEFVLLGLGAGVAIVLSRAWRHRPTWRRHVRPFTLALAIAAGASLIQGGTLTEVARNLVSPTENGSSPGTLAGFAFRLPPAFVSSHLGELPLDHLSGWVVGAFEMGPALALAPILVWAGVRWWRRRRFLLVAVSLSAWFGILLPMVLRYDVDRDITRMTQYALLAWIILGLPTLGQLLRLRPRAWFRTAVLVWGASLSLAGVAILGSLLTALATPTLSNEISPVDATMTRAVWDELPADARVLDSAGWRAVAVTGRLTRSSSDSSTVLDSWRALTREPDTREIAQAGFGYVYVDSYWWNSMSTQARTSFSRACVALVAEVRDNGANGSRWLYDVRSCP